MSDELNYVLQARRDKIDALQARGIAPFAYGFDRTHLAGECAALLGDGAEGPPVQLAGRIVAWRAHGKTTFAHLGDPSGRVQLYFKKDILGEAGYALCDLLDLGDVIGVRGPLFRTRTGEVTVKVEHLELLAKSLRPLPVGKEEVVDGKTVRHSAFADGEQRSRQRYADLAVHPEVRALFVARSRMNAAIRAFLDGLGYLEVETPVLQPLYGGAAAKPFVTQHNALDMPLFLRIADERDLKRLVVGGFDRVYEIGHDFRNEGIDRTHNPEFTMLEFYQAYADYTGMMARVEALLIAAATAVRDALSAAGLASDAPAFDPAMLQGPFPRMEWLPALSHALHVADVTKLTDAELRTAAEHAAVHGVATLSRPKLMDELFQHHVESRIERPTFVVDYPK